MNILTFPIWKGILIPVLDSVFAIWPGNPYGEGRPNVITSLGVNLDYRRRLKWGKWQEGIGFVPSLYSLLAFAIAAAQIFVFDPASYAGTLTAILIIAVGIYTFLKILRPFRLRQPSTLTYHLLGIDVAVCISLVVLTGGLYSPFLLYTLAPVLTAALLLNRKVTFAIAGLSGGYVIGSHFGSPFFYTPISVPELSFFIVYMIAVGLAATLPYLINVNLRQRLQSEDIIGERQRLSREIHDGTAQTLATLCWQVQFFRRRLTEMGIHMDEAEQLEKLAEKARQDTRASLELLRNNTVNGSFLALLKAQLEQLRQETNIDCNIDADTEEIHLEAPVGLELLRICQEALANIRKHSGARNVQIKLKPENQHLGVSISDDGHGFDAVSYYHDGVEGKGHGLAVMKERAESVGGQFRVMSMPGDGTEIEVEMPVASRQSRLSWLK